MPKLPQQSQILKQCQHCFKSEREVPLQCCSNCKRAHYCSTECQRAEWKRHKSECQSIKEYLKMLKQMPSTAGISVSAVEKGSKTWVQLFRPYLSVTALHALELQRDPNRVFTHLLHLIIAPNFTDEVPKKIIDLETAFKLEDASVFSVQDFLEVAPAHRTRIETLIQDSRQTHAQDPKAFGIAVVLVAIPQYNIARVIPLGIEDGPPHTPWDPQWKAQLAEIMERGISG